MLFISARDLRSQPGKLWDSLATGQEAVITSNGRPAAVMVGLGDGDVEETVLAFRQARALRNLQALRTEVGRRGHLSDDEVNAEIIQARTDRAKPTDSAT